MNALPLSDKGFTKMHGITSKGITYFGGLASSLISIRRKPLRIIEQKNNKYAKYAFAAAAILMAGAITLGLSTLSLNTHQFVLDCALSFGLSSAVALLGFRYLFRASSASEEEKNLQLQQESIGAIEGPVYDGT